MAHFHLTRSKTKTKHDSLLSFFFWHFASSSCIYYIYLLPLLGSFDSPCALWWPWVITFGFMMLKQNSSLGNKKQFLITLLEEERVENMIPSFECLIDMHASGQMKFRWRSECRLRKSDRHVLIQLIKKWFIIMLNLALVAMLREDAP